MKTFTKTLFAGVMRIDNAACADIGGERHDAAYVIRERASDALAYLAVRSRR